MGQTLKTVALILDGSLQLPGGVLKTQMSNLVLPQNNLALGPMVVVKASPVIPKYR